MSTSEIAECQAVAAKIELSDEERKAEALECLMNGKRDLLCKDIPAAVSSFTEACEELSVVCGEKSPECGEAYFYYGKALLEMARLENAVLGNALSGVPEAEDPDASAQVENPENITDEERADIEEKVDEALEENFDSCEQVETPLLTIEAVEDVTTGTEEMTEKISEMEVDSQEEDEPRECDHADDKAGATEHEVKAAEEPSTLQLAWEVLDLSKLISKEQLEGVKSTAGKDTITAMEKRLCDTYLLLSEVSLESENFGQAVEDLQVCLERQKAVLPADSRDIAVTHYQLGVALGFDKKYDEATTSLEAAVTVLNNMMASLKEKTGRMAKMEVTEIEALVPEIKAKIADILEIKAGKVDIENLKGLVCSNKPVNTIPIKKAVA